MISFKIYELVGISQEQFTNVFEKYDETVDNIDEPKIELKASTINFITFKEEQKHLINFEFQHDFKYSYQHRGEWFSYPRSYNVELWVYFKNNKNYIFVSGKKDAISFIIPHLSRIIADKIFLDVSINKLNITSKALVTISREDGIIVNSSWFNKLDESLKSVYMGGHLDDENNNIHELYKHVKEKAGDITSINFTSRKLGFPISISRKKGSIWTKSETTQETIINYFEEIIEKEL